MSDEDVSFIIIGDEWQNQTSEYKKVFDFGKSYDEDIKLNYLKYLTFVFNLHGQDYL